MRGSACEAAAPVRASAPAKLNLILHVGPRRPGGLHEICSLFASLELADTLDVTIASARWSGEGVEDVVECPGVVGENLIGVALREFRASADGATLPPLRVAVEKRIPVAAGLGGGSADAAAILRVANALAGERLDGGALGRLAQRVGADVASQLSPGHALVTGAGEVVEPLVLPAMEIVLVPSADGLSTAAVYAEADRLGATRPALDPGAVRAAAELPLEALPGRVENDLERAALSLRPELGEGLAELRAAGALAAAVTGSGPTLFGIFASRSAADAAARSLPGALVTRLSGERLRNN